MDINERVDEIFAPWDRSGAPGCALAVIKDGRIVHARGYGTADLAHDVSITSTTVFHAASLSKQFTAMAVVLLVQQGKVSLDGDVRTYLAEFPDLGTPITIRHLLHHTSGVRDQWRLVVLAGWRLGADVVTARDVRRLVTRMKALDFAPGDQYAYSNTGYTVAAAIVERASGQSLADFTKENIFEPLGMTCTRFRESHAETVKHVASGYRAVHGGRFEAREPHYDLVGPTNLLTTVEDLHRWDRNFETKAVGGASGVAEMMKPGTLNDGRTIPYGLGLMLSEYRGLPIVEHDGRDPGYRSHLIRFPEQRFSVACLCNLEMPEAHLPGELARRIADIYLANHLRPPSRPLRPRAAGRPLRAGREKVGVYWCSQIEQMARVDAGGKGLELTAVGERGHLTARTGSVIEWITGSQRAEVQFTSPGAGIAERLVLRRDGHETLTFEMMPPPDARPEALAEFCGSYASDELDATYRIDVAGQWLVLRRPKYDAVRLEPVFRDAFTFDNLYELSLPDAGVLRFTRDGQKRLTGFTLTDDPIRHLLFVKQRA